MRYAILVMLLALAGCHADVRHQFPGKPLACLTAQALAKIQADPQRNLAVAYTACRSEFAERLRAFDLKDNDQRLLFSSIVAQALKPYGSSTAVTLPALLNSKFLACDNYVILAGYFAEILVPARKDAMIAIGVDGGVVGNHAQIIFRLSDGREVLADPTVGLFADESFNDLFSGRHVPEDKIVVMHMHNDPATDKFGERVYRAIADGGYRPSDILYYSRGLNDYLAFSDMVAPAFLKGSIPEIVLHYPTPAAEALRQNLLITQRQKNKSE
jgi:hypothetical protein